MGPLCGLSDEYSSITIPESVTHIGASAFLAMHFFGKHHHPLSLWGRMGSVTFDSKLQVVIQHVWLCLFVGSVGTLLFKLESATMGLCVVSVMNILSSRNRQASWKERRNRKILRWETWPRGNHPATPRDWSWIIVFWKSFGPWFALQTNSSPSG